MPILGQNITIVAGNSLSVHVTVSDEDGAAIDLTGATVKWQVATSPDGTRSDPVISKQTGSGISILASGVTIAIDPIDTITLRPGTYYHEVQVSLGDGTVGTVTQGTFLINPSIIKNI